MSWLVLSLRSLWNETVSLLFVGPLTCLERRENKRPDGRRRQHLGGKRATLLGKVPCPLWCHNDVWETRCHQPFAFCHTTNPFTAQTNILRVALINDSIDFFHRPPPPTNTVLKPRPNRLFLTALLSAAARLKSPGVAREDGRASKSTTLQQNLSLALHCVLSLPSLSEQPAIRPRFMHPWAQRLKLFYIYRII